MMLQYGEKVLTLLVDREPLEHTERLVERGWGFVPSLRDYHKVAGESTSCTPKVENDATVGAQGWRSSYQSKGHTH